MSCPIEVANHKLESGGGADLMTGYGWRAPTEWSGSNVSALTAFGPRERWLLELAGGIPAHCAAGRYCNGAAIVR